jgi:C4-dicarboxylate-specific signal transduction histidine kinase
MARAVRLLIVEDVEDHALLIVRELQKSGFAPDFERVETREGLVAALDASEWEAVISDFSLPGFNALDVLEIVQKQGLDLPVIIVSGVISEESAVDAMRAGAKDFILKGKYSRLAPALDRELRDAANRRERRVAAGDLVRAHEELKIQRAELETQHRELLETYNRLAQETAERIRTVEELRHKEQMMVHQTRMAAIGEVLNNIAHHWRQPLNVLALSLQDLELEFEVGTFSKELLHSHVAAGLELIHKLSRVIDDFIDFSAVCKEQSRFSVEQAVVRTVSLVADNFARRHIAIETILSDGLEIVGCENDFRQVVLYLLMNARDAFDERGKSEGRIGLRSWPEDGRTVLTITDNAGGIPGENIAKIFAPFYTTKPEGKGTGVGLFIAKNVIEKDMGGRLTARNVEDGAEFRIEV